MVENFLEQIISNCDGLSIFGTKEDPLFIAKDVAELLGYKRARDILKIVEPSEVAKRVIKIDCEVEQKDDGLKMPPLFYQQNHEVLMLTEEGLYEVLFRSNHMIAKTFKNKLKQHLKQMRLESIRKVLAELEELKIKLDQSSSYMTILGYIISNKLNPDDYNIKSIGKYLTKRSNEMEIPIKKVIDSRYGEINSYSVLLLSEYFNQVQQE